MNEELLENLVIRPEILQLALRMEWAMRKHDYTKGDITIDIFIPTMKSILTKKQEKEIMKIFDAKDVIYVEGNKNHYPFISIKLR